MNDSVSPVYQQINLRTWNPQLRITVCIPYGFIGKDTCNTEFLFYLRDMIFTHLFKSQSCPGSSWWQINRVLPVVFIVAFPILQKVEIKCCIVIRQLIMRPVPALIYCLNVNKLYTFRQRLSRSVYEDATIVKLIFPYYLIFLCSYPPFFRTTLIRFICLNVKKKGRFRLIQSPLLITQRLISSFCFPLSSMSR